MNEQGSYRFLDKLLSEYKTGNTDPFNQSNADKYWKEVAEYVKYRDQAIEKLDRDKFIAKNPSNGKYEITFEGIAFEGYEKQSKRLKREKNRYWIPIIISIVALICPILFQTLNYFDNQSNKNKLKELEQKVRSIDSIRIQHPHK